jgi:FAD:protein FMN transferase
MKGTKGMTGKLNRRQWLIAGGTVLAYGGLGALAWRRGLLEVLTGTGNKLESADFAAMGTYLTITTPQGEQPERLRTVVESVRAVEERMSIFQSASELSRLNAAGPGVSFALSPELREVLQLACRVFEQSGGAFDPTVAPLMRVWGFQGGRPTRLPDLTSVRGALRHTSLAKLAWDGDRVSFQEEGMSADLGGIAKGYAVDRAALSLKNSGGVGLINAGGDIRAAGSRPEGEPWLVGIRDPQRKQKILATMELPADHAVATSGTYEHYVELEGKRLPHVLDPRSGQPVDGVVSATVTAPTAVEADALATASVVLGEREALSLLGRLSGVEGLLVVRRGSGPLAVETTSGFRCRLLQDV